LKREDENYLVRSFRQAMNRLILLDYDGTLVDYASTPDLAKPPGNLFNPLLRLSKLPQTKVVIITGRSDEDIDSFFGSLPIQIIAEHGAMIKELSGWQQLTQVDSNWIGAIREIFAPFAADCPGSFVEVKKFSLAWHYRNADKVSGLRVSKALLKKLKSAKELEGLTVLEGNKVIEIRKTDVHKGMAVNYLTSSQEYDFILAIGDDRTDEDMFKALVNNENGFTIKVGSGETFAKERIENVQQVIALLESL